MHNTDQPSDGAHVTQEQWLKICENEAASSYLVGALRAVKHLIDENPNQLPVTGVDLGCLFQSFVLLAERADCHSELQSQKIFKLEKRHA